MGLATASVAALCVETVPPDHRAIAMRGCRSAIYLGMMVSAAGLGPQLVGLTGYQGRLSPDHAHHGHDYRDRLSAHEKFLSALIRSVG